MDLRTPSQEYPLLSRDFYATLLRFVRRALGELLR